MKKQITVVLLALVLVLTVAAGIACQPTTYTLTYESGLGGGTAPVTEKYAEGAQVTLKAANTFTAPADKEFDGWLVDGAKKAAGDKITMPAKDLTVTAQWKTKTEPQPEKWTVTFKNGEKTVDTVEVVKGQKLTASQIPAAPEGIPETQEFKGWFNGETRITVDTEITSNITAIAKIEDKAPAHVCGHVCEICGKCTSDCTDAACADKCQGHGFETAIDSWWVAADDATADTQAGKDHLATFTFKAGKTSIQPSFKLKEDYHPTADNKYLAIKFSGTATLKNVLLWGTGPDDKVVPGWSAGNVAEKDWLVPVKVLGSDFSVVVIDLGSACTAHGVDTVTNLGFLVEGTDDDTFIVNAIELLASTEHNFGTPTPPEEEPGELTVGDLVPGWDGNGFTVTKDGNDQTVSFSSARGYELVKAEISHYSDELAFLYLDVTLNDDINLGVYAGGTSLYEHVKVSSGDRRIAIPLSGKELGSSFVLNFYFNAVSNPGTDYDAENPKTVVFHEISFKETDPTVSSEPDHFRTPVGNAGVDYSESDKKITYTNSADPAWRYLEIVLDNHSGADVLVFNLTGYNGLVLGVQVYGEKDLEGSITTFTTNIWDSAAYYSTVKTDNAVQYVFYLAADGLTNGTVKGVRLYFDAPANAGKVGDVELTLNSIEMKKSSELNPADVAITADNVEITFGGTPNFNAVIKAGETTVDGTVIYEYREKGSTDPYKAGIPTAIGEYDVRLYYVGSLQYKYSRSTVVTLKITEDASHSHVWATDWSSNATHHWHECTAAGCNVTDNADKDGYAEHVFTDGGACVCGKTPPKPIEIGEMTNDSNNGFVITKEDDGSTKVTRDVHKGTANTIVTVKNWDSSKKYLVIELQANGKCGLGISSTPAAWPDLTGAYKQTPTNERTTFVIDLTGKNLSETEFNLYFIYDGTGWGTALAEGDASEITFYSISFSATDPTAAAN